MLRDFQADPTIMNASRLVQLEDLYIGGICIKMGMIPTKNVKCVVCGNIVLREGIRYSKHAIRTYSKDMIPDIDHPVCIAGEAKCRLIYDTAPIV